MRLFRVFQRGLSLCMTQTEVLRAKRKSNCHAIKWVGGFKPTALKMYRCTNPEVVTWCSHYLRRPFGLRLLNHNNGVSSEWNQARSARRYYQFWLVDCMHGHSGNRTDDVCLPSTLKDWAPDCQKGAECPASDNSEKSIRSFGDWKANSPKTPSMFLLWVNLGKLACIWLTWCEAVQHANAIAMPSLYLSGCSFTACQLSPKPSVQHRKIQDTCAKVPMFGVDSVARTEGK